MFGILVDRIKYQLTDLQKDKGVWHYKALELGMSYAINGTLSDTDKLFRIKLDVIDKLPYTVPSFEPATLSDIDCKIIVRCQELSLTNTPIAYRLNRLDSHFMQTQHRRYELAPYSSGIVTVHLANGNKLMRVWSRVKGTEKYIPQWNLYDVRTETEYQVRELTGIKK